MHIESCRRQLREKPGDLKSPTQSPGWSGANFKKSFKIIVLFDVVM